MSGLLVMKFGGTSMGSAERMKVAAQICTEQKQRRPVVTVVSAMAKVTDMLLDTLRHAEGGDETGLEANVQRIKERHCRTCEELFHGNQHARVAAEVEALIVDFQRIARGVLMLGERPPRSVDEAIAMGERLSALMLAEYLTSTGVP